MAGRERTAAHYVIVWLALMGLALASFLLSLAPLGTAGPAVAMGIGVAKAALIAWFFMHLVEQASIARWAFVLGLALAALLLVMVSLDVVTREQPALRQPGLSTSAPGQRSGTRDQVRPERNREPEPMRTSGTTNLENPLEP